MRKAVWAAVVPLLLVPVATARAGDKPPASAALVASLRGLLADDARLSAVDAATASKLGKKLDNVDTALTSRAQVVADNALNAFVNAVRASRGKGLQTGAGDALAATAEGKPLPPVTVSPTTTTALAATVGTTPVTVTVPPGSGIATLTVTSRTAPALPSGQTALASIEVSGKDASGAPVSTLGAPVTLELTVPTGSKGALKVATLKPGTTTQELLPTTTQPVGGQVRVTAKTPHFSPFTVVAIDPARGFVRVGNTAVEHAAEEAGERSAVTLADGRVMLLGSSDRFESQQPQVVEVFDPADGSWSRTGDLDIAGYGVDGVLLADGRVLAHGYAGTELWDPSTGQWSPGPSDVTVPPYSHLVPVGGTALAVDRGSYQPSAFVFDATANTWLPAGTAPLVVQYSVDLLDGTALVVGYRYEGQYSYPRGFARFSLADHTWSAFHELDRADGQAWRQADGTVLLMSNDRHFSVVDPSTDQVRPVDLAAGSSLPETSIVGRERGALLGDGTLLVVGGIDQFSYPFTSPPAFLFDPRTGSVTVLGHSLVDRHDHLVVSLRDGSALVTGGSNSDRGVLLSEVWTGIPAGGTVEPGPTPDDAYGSADYYCDPAIQVCN